VEQTQGKPIIESAFGLITSVVVGAILDLTIFLGRAVIIPSGVVGLKEINAISLGWVILSLLLLQRFQNECASLGFA
jgi:chromate transporter